MNNQTLFISVLNRGKAEQVLSEMRIFGLTGGVVLLGEGTVSNRFLEILGLEETQKDIVILPIEEKYENAVHEMMLENFNIDRKRSGIAFSIPMSRFGRVSNLALIRDLILPALIINVFLLWWKRDKAKRSCKRCVKLVKPEALFFMDVAQVFLPILIFR